jgi:fumarate reductase subunit D
MGVRNKPAERPVEPLLWLLFSGGGVVAALFAPILLFLLGVAIPLGWIDPPGHADVLALARNPLTRLVVFGVCVLSLAHWAHRFRYTLYDGLQLKHSLINLACYGGALLGSALTAVVLLML